MALRDRFIKLLETGVVNHGQKLSMDFQKKEAYRKALIEAKKCKHVLLYGAGEMGTALYKYLHDCMPDADIGFIDSDEKKWDTTILDGASVYSPTKAQQCFGNDALVIITVQAYFLFGSLSKKEIQEKLDAFQFTNVYEDAALMDISDGWIPAGWLSSSWLVPRRAYFASTPCNEQLMRVFDSLADDFSKAVLYEWIRTTYELDVFRYPVTPVQYSYFPPDLYDIKPMECFIDCGAFTGDTLSAFRNICEDKFHRYYAFEPDKNNLVVLEEELSSLPPETNRKIRIYPYAVGCENGQKTFYISDGVSSGSNLGALTYNDNASNYAVTVDVARLDDISFECPPTIIKMDIEGGELNALIGAKNTIRTHRPVLSICVYHRPEDIVEIPEWIMANCPDYRLAMRQHMPLCPTETVLYAIPAERSKY